MAGITQPGGAGTTIFVEDNANADSNLDGVNLLYSFTDFALKGLASGDYTDLATTGAKSFRSKATVQNGDGAGTQATTIKDARASLIFDTGKTLTFSTVGQVSRGIELGTKVVGASGKPSGKDGCKLVICAAANWRGTVKVYASHIESTTGTFSIIPGSTGLPGELVDVILQSGGNVAIGNTSGELALVFNLDMSFVGNFALANWNATYAERVSICGTGNFLINAGGANVIRIRDLLLIGTPAGADIRSTGSAEWDFVEPTWTDAAPQVNTAVSYVNEWWRGLPTIQDPTSGVAVASFPIRILDKDGADVLPVTYTDSLGQFTYGGSDPITQNCLKARRALGSAGAVVWEERGPFTVRVNMDGATLPGYIPYSFKQTWPRVTGTYGDLLRPWLDTIPAYPIGYWGTGSPATIDGLPLVADEAVRVFMPIPSAQ